MGQKNRSDRPYMSISINFPVGGYSIMEKLTILVGRLYNSVAPTKHFFKVPLVRHFKPLVDRTSQLVESPLNLVLLPTPIYIYSLRIDSTA